jgi:hypothetical protein
MVEHNNEEEIKEGAGTLLECEGCEEQVDTASDNWAPCFPCMKKGCPAEAVPVKHEECIGADQSERVTERGYVMWLMTGRWACKRCCWIGADFPDLDNEQEAQRQEMRDYLKAKQAR